MSVGRVTEITSTSTESFDAAIQAGIARASETLRGVQSAWVKEQSVRVENGAVASYQVHLLVTFVLDD